MIDENNILFVLTEAIPYKPITYGIHAQLSRNYSASFSISESPKKASSGTLLDKAKER